MAEEEAGAAASASAEIERCECNESVIIDIPADLEFELWSKCCIQRVPKKLRKVKQVAYTPQLLSIGPFHHGKTELLGMEHLKRRYYYEFCKRVGKNQSDLRGFIHSLHEELRRSYAGTVELKKELFLDMVMVDACFIIELFLRNSEKRGDDYILRTPWLRKDIEMDLILFENQLPYVFLKQLFDFVAITKHAEAGHPMKENQNNPEKVPLLSKHQHQNESSHPFSKHTRDFFSFSRHVEISEVNGIKHFTDLVRRVLCPKKIKPSQTNNMSYIFCATKLDTAGVSFVPTKNPRLTDLEILSGTTNLLCIPCLPCMKSTQLKVPELKVDDDTECLLRNVMSLEQCLYPHDAYVCNYIMLLDQLINTTEDVDLLVEKKIVRNLLGSNDVVAKLINKLCDQIVETNYYYYGVSEKLNAHCDNCFNSTKATIKRIYFKDCWTASTAIVGFCVLVFSVSATIKSLFFS